METPITIEILSVLNQLFFAIAGAGALWGAVFSHKLRKAGTGEEVATLFSLVKSLLFLVSGFVILGGIVWSLKYFILPEYLFAHEGIVILPNLLDAGRGVLAGAPIFVLILIMSLWSFLNFRKYGAKYLPRAYVFFVTQFVLIFIIMSISFKTNALDRTQFFFAGHSFHSIFTVGTVIILDFLFFLSHHIPDFRRNLYSIFPTMSKVIWLGLGFDFLSVWLIFHEGFALHDKFYFMQTLIAIIILNGAILSGPLTDIFKQLMKKEGAVSDMPHKIHLIAGISGCISISSWLSITVIDGFSRVPFSYSTMMFAYLAIILSACLVHFVFLTKGTGGKIAKKIQSL